MLSAWWEEKHLNTDVVDKYKKYNVFVQMVLAYRTFDSKLNENAKNVKKWYQTFEIDAAPEIAQKNSVKISKKRMKFCG